MATVVQGRLPAEEFALCETLDSLPDAEFETELIVESGEDAIMPLLWVRGAPTEAVREVLERDPSVRSVDLLVELDDAQFYRMEWVGHVELALELLTNAHATIMNAYGAGDWWYLRVLYPDRDSLGRTTDFCERHGLSFDIDTIREMDGEPAGRFGLTDGQYAALTYAVEQGYYDVPRGCELQDLADHFGLSHQALSERLRRGVKALVEDALLVGAPAPEVATRPGR
ncbi:helix-turn-helix domain-containing protein [Halomarina ordinaria]|uniref:Helix-turn-helix domain-containing protein n=1 Tax=Halomarina ordinaria TaxID=3033939 RepID=A0ABD5U492_9EURY|nr:helix-turn-helix domain-containing protein [Halomarina sp. PSRA2]